MMERVLMDFGRYGPLFDVRYGDAAYDDSMKLVHLVYRRRGYALFMVARAIKNPESPLALLPSNVIGKIANLAAMARILDKDE